MPQYHHFFYFRCSTGGVVLVRKSGTESNHRIDFLISSTIFCLPPQSITGTQWEDNETSRENEESYP